MIEINIDPTMISLGPLLITWHGFFSAVGLAGGLWMTSRLAHGTALTADDVSSVAMPAVIGGIIGARALFVLENWWLFADRPLGALAINEGGISVYGAVIGGSLAGWLFALYSKRPVALLADRAAIGLIVGQGIGRIGDIINGEHHGRNAEGFPLSVSYTHPTTLGELGAPVHLAVGYELIYDLLVGAVLIWLLRRQPKDGMAYLAYLFFYGLGRLWVGFYRKDTLVLGDLGMAQLLGVVSMLITVPWLLWRLRSAPPDRARRRRAGRG